MPRPFKATTTAIVEVDVCLKELTKVWGRYKIDRATYARDINMAQTIHGHDYEKRAEQTAEAQEAALISRANYMDSIREVKDIKHLLSQAFGNLIRHKQL